MFRVRRTQKQGVILILGRMLELIVEALDHDDPDHAAEIASEALAELRRVLVAH